MIAAQPFPNNIIPSNRFDSVSAKMSADAIWGHANLPGTDVNLYYSSIVRRKVHQGDGRLDYNTSEKDRFFFRYSGMKSLLDNATSINQFYQDGNADSDSYNQNMHLTNMHMFGPTKMNELRLAYNRTNVVTSAKSMDKEWNNFYGLKNGNLGDPVTRGSGGVQRPRSSAQRRRSRLGGIHCRQYDLNNREFRLGRRAVTT